MKRRKRYPRRQASRKFLQKLREWLGELEDRALLEKTVDRATGNVVSVAPADPP